MNERINRRQMMKRAVVGATAAMAVPTAIVASRPLATPAPAKFSLDPFDYRGVRLTGGMLKKQYDATRDYFFNLPDDDILKGMRKRAGLAAPGRDMGAWGSEDTSMLFGQWLSGMARMSRATGDNPIREKAGALMAEWAKTIEPNGTAYHPTLAKDLKYSHYAWEKFIYGLVDLYQYADNKDAIPLLERMTDWGAKNLDRTRKAPTTEENQGVSPEWYTLSENLYRAFLLTGDSRYRSFGDLWLYPHYWNMFNGPTEPNPYLYHAYSHVNTFGSAAMAYVLTRDPSYLKTLIGGHDYFVAHQCYATGGYGPAERLVASDGELGRSLEREANTFETPCGTWAVFKLGRYLLTFTGEARFGDWMERVLYNGLGAALPMGPEGKTHYYSDYRLSSSYPLGSPRKLYYWDPYPCCAGTYIQAVADYHNIIYYRNQSGLAVNLFVPSEAVWNHAGTEIKVVQETSYPESDTTNLTVHTPQSVTFDLKFRVPGWADGATVKVNGSNVDVACKPGAWGVVGRTWQSGDRLTIQIPMRLRFEAIDRQHPNRVALMYGPVVIVQEGRYTKGLRKRPTDQDLSKLIVPTGNPLEFHITDRPSGPFVLDWGKFMAYYQVRPGDPYRMYFDLET